MRCARPDLPHQGGAHAVQPSGRGGADTFLRAVSTQLSAQLGQSVAVENKPTTGAQMAAAEAAKASADGYTLFAADNGSLVMYPTVYKKLPCDTAAFAPVGVMARTPLVLVASKDSGFKNAKDMLESVNTNPGKSAYASANIGSSY